MPITKTDVYIQNTAPHHGEGIYEVIRSAFGLPDDEYCDTCFSTPHVTEHLRRFPEGHFVALAHDRVVGVAITMRTRRPPYDPPLPWLEAIGGLNMTAHQPDGPWLYGVEMAIHPDYQGLGIGSRLYQARFALVKRLNLRGWYAGGVLMGYHRYADTMSLRQYGEKVIAREIEDPTVTMQMNRGFEAWQVVENYIDERLSGNGAVLIVWKNPDYKE